MTRLFGPLSAAAILLLGAASIYRAPTAAETAAASSSLGTLLAVVAGLFSAMWWHQSASVSDEAGDIHTSDCQQRNDASVLNAAAATTTGLALIASVFSTLAWSSLEGLLAGLTFLTLLAMSGREIWRAAALSFRQGLRPRSVLACVVLVLASALFVVRRLVL